MTLKGTTHECQSGTTIRCCGCSRGEPRRLSDEHRGRPGGCATRTGEAARLPGCSRRRRHRRAHPVLAGHASGPQRARNHGSCADGGAAREAAPGHRLCAGLRRSRALHTPGLRRRHRARARRVPTRASGSLQRQASASTASTTCRTTSSWSGSSQKAFCTVGQAPSATTRHLRGCKRTPSPERRPSRRPNPGHTRPQNPSRVVERLSASNPSSVATGLLRAQVAQAASLLF